MTSQVSIKHYLNKSVEPMAALFEIHTQVQSPTVTQVREHSFLWRQKFWSSTLSTSYCAIACINIYLDLPHVVKCNTATLTWLIKSCIIEQVYGSVWCCVELTGMRHDSASHSKRHLAVACRCMHEVNDITVWSTRHWHPVYRHQLVTRAQTPIPLRRAVLDNRSNYDLWQLIRGEHILI